LLGIGVDTTALKSFDWRRRDRMTWGGILHIDRHWDITSRMKCAVLPIISL
jgi:hypothetical protein